MVQQKNTKKLIHSTTKVQEKSKDKIRSLSKDNDTLNNGMASKKAWLVITNFKSKDTVNPFSVDTPSFFVKLEDMSKWREILTTTWSRRG